MKKLVIAALALGSFSAAAQQFCQVELQYQGTILGQNVFIADNCRDAMRECKRTEKTYERNHMLDELQCVRVDDAQTTPPTFPVPGDDNNQPLPPGNGGYNPPGNGGYNPPVPSQPLITVVGKIESTPIRLEGRTADQVYNQCLDVYEREIRGNADELMVSVNGHKYQTVTTSGWWYGAEAVCDQIDALITQDTMIPPMPMFLRAVGRIETIDFEFVANSVAELFNKCVDFVDAANMGNVDEVYVSVNDSRRQRYATSGWWRTPTAVCENILLPIQ